MTVGHGAFGIMEAMSSVGVTDVATDSAAPLKRVQDSDLRFVAVTLE